MLVYCAYTLTAAGKFFSRHVQKLLVLEACSEPCCIWAVHVNGGRASIGVFIPKWTYEDVGDAKGSRLASHRTRPTVSVN